MMQDVHVRVRRELAQVDSPMSTVGDVAMGLEVTFLNSAVDSVGKHCPKDFTIRGKETRTAKARAAQGRLSSQPAMLLMSLQRFAWVSMLLYSFNISRWSTDAEVMLHDGQAQCGMTAVSALIVKL